MISEEILLVCGSKKPAPGKDGPSAAREMLKAVGEGITEQGETWNWIDLREVDLPHFDGRQPAEYASADLEKAMELIRGSARLVLSVPAYWGGPAGVVKNFLDLIGGASYDAPDSQLPPLEGKLIALLIVGSDNESAYAAAGGMRTVLASMGAWTMPRSFVVGNPREVKSVSLLLAKLKNFGRYVATASKQSLTFEKV